MEESICPKENDCAEELKMPGVLDLAKNLANDTSKIISNAFKGNTTLVPDEVRVSRWSTCQACPLLVNDRCTKCGCFMKIKVAFYTSVCPENKW